MAMCGMPPRPVEANTSLPGCDFARATSSASVLTGTVSLTTRISGTDTICVMSAKSLSGWKGMFSRRLTFMASPLEGAIASV